MIKKRSSWIDAFGWLLGLVYVLGYLVTLVAAGIYAWPRMGFWAWLNYMEWQSFYALIWPVWLLISAVAGIIAGLSH